MQRKILQNRVVCSVYALRYAVFVGCDRGIRAEDQIERRGGEADERYRKTHAGLSFRNRTGKFVNPFIRLERMRFFPGADGAIGILQECGEAYRNFFVRRNGSGAAVGKGALQEGSVSGGDRDRPLRRRVGQRLRKPHAQQGIRLHCYLKTRTCLRFFVECKVEQGARHPNVLL